MSYSLYPISGLRFWRQEEIELREAIQASLVACVQRTLLDMNQMWRFERVDAPVMMPVSRLSCPDHTEDVFKIGQLADEPFCLRAETTNGSYLMAKQLLTETTMRPPLCVWSVGKSFRQERSDGATAAKLRFNEFYQLEFQCIFTEGTKAPIAETLAEALKIEVARITNQPTRLVDSDRLPAYSKKTTDIEAHWGGEYKEVASMSQRTDFQAPPGQKPCEVFEVAFGLDRMVCLAKGSL